MKFLRERQSIDFPQLFLSSAWMVWTIEKTPRKIETEPSACSFDMEPRMWLDQIDEHRITFLPNNFMLLTSSNLRTPFSYKDPANDIPICISTGYVYLPLKVDGIMVEKITKTPSSLWRWHLRPTTLMTVTLDTAFKCKKAFTYYSNVTSLSFQISRASALAEFAIDVKIFYCYKYKISQPAQRYPQG